MKKLFLSAVALATVVASGPSSAADLPAAMPMKASATVPYLNWTGFYVGVNAGYGWGDPSSHLDFIQPAGALSSAPLAPGDFNTRTSGFIGGLQAGYNYQINAIVVGAETDFQYANINGTTTTPSTPIPALMDFAHVSLSQKLSWFGTTRGRIGVLPTSNLLIYGTGGVAYAKVNATSLFAFDTPPFHSWSGSTSQTNTGWTVGGGAEWALNRAWSVKAEYLYYNLGAINVIGTRPGDTVFMTNYDQKVTGSTARLGLNFKVGN